jgi:hypothetical protein
MFLVQCATKKVCISLNWLLSSMNICLQTKLKHGNELANFVATFSLILKLGSWKRNLQVRSELGNRALKSDLKSTNTTLTDLFTFQTRMLAQY